MERLPILKEIIPDEIFVGTSLILHQDGRFLYGIRPAKHQGGDLILELTGIGGGMEEEDASFSAGALREAQEEIGSDVLLAQSQNTLVVRSRRQVEELSLGGQERPAALVTRNYRTPPHQPWHADNQGAACLIVFLGELLGDPWPTMELPWLMWLTPELILETARRDVSLTSLLHSGAELIVGDSGGPPETSVTRLTDSQEALAIALGDQTPAVYRSFT